MSRSLARFGAAAHRNPGHRGPNPILLYLIAVLVLPELDQDENGEVSLREHYYEARPWFYGLSALIPVATAVRNAGFQADALWRTARSSSPSSSSRSRAPSRRARACTALSPSSCWACSP
ncbi:MAG TPA: hypothetical protein VF142_13010 [Longimicrobium sp.]